MIQACAAQGTPVDLDSIGNEVRNGMLWPVGRLDGSQQQGDAFATLLKAGIAGARSGNPRGTSCACDRDLPVACVGERSGAVRGSS